MNDIKEGYDRVTECLNHISGLNNIPKDILDNAKERGKKVDIECRLFMKFKDMASPTIPNNIKGYVDSFKLWSANKTFLNNIDRFYCDELMITGEVDGMYDIKEGLCLFDIKTPLKESPTWSLQLSAYANLARKNRYNIRRIEVIQLSRDGKYPKVIVYEEDFERYLICLDQYRYFFKSGKQKDYLEYL